MCYTVSEPRSEQRCSCGLLSCPAREGYTNKTMEPASTPIPQKAPGAYGSLFSIIMIVVILVVGAFYVWNKRVAQNYQYATDETETLQVEVAVPAE